MLVVGPVPLSRGLDQGAACGEFGPRGPPAYRFVIRGLIDIIDNVVAGASSPPDPVCLDGINPYLVVAADKGRHRVVTR